MATAKKTTAKQSLFVGFTDELQTTSAFVPPAPTLYHRDTPYIAHPTYGIVLPIEMADSHIPTNVHVPTDGLRATSKIVVSVLAASGTMKYNSPPLDINPSEALVFTIPQAELRRFADKKVVIQYAITEPGKNPVNSGRLNLRVTAPLTYSAPIVEGLKNGVLKAADYPDGLNVDGGLIGNLEAPSIVYCVWDVTIYTEDGGATPIYNLRQTSLPTAGQPYIFRIPAEAYSNPSWASIVTCSCKVGVDFAPHDPQLAAYGTGGHEFSLK